MGLGTAPLLVEFHTYVDYLNRLNNHSDWYNEVTKNRTTTINRQLAADAHGTLDELLYGRGRRVTGGLPFPELKRREHINAAGRAADASPDFSSSIRAGRLGF